MKSLFEEFGGTYTLGKDEMYYPNLTIDDNDHRLIGKWGMMHEEYLKKEHPDLYEQLLLNGMLHTHLVDANERALEMLERLIKQMAHQENVTERLKAEQPMIWVGRIFKKTNTPNLA